MLIAYPKTRAKGFSLIELMIGVAIMAVLIGFALPSFRSMIRNTHTRNAAESIQNGMQRARSEAVKLNTNVSFVLAADSSWTVSVVAPPTVIESKPSSDGAINVQRAVLPAASTSITFNSMGGVITALGPITQVDLSAIGGDKNLRILIGTGGNIKMCDPHIPSSNPRGCP